MLEEIYEDGSLKLWLASFGEMFFDQDVSDEISEFVREKMRARLKDQRLIDVLVPTDYGFGTHRVPLERNYLEVYHRTNVELVGVLDNPIARILPEGIELADGTVHELDVIVLATGFDAGTGALTRIDVRGREGRRSPTSGAATSARRWACRARLPEPAHHRRPARPLGGPVQHDHLPPAADRVDQRRHPRTSASGAGRRSSRRRRARTPGRPPRGDRGRHADREHEGLVPRLERAGQAAPCPVLHRRGGDVPAEVRRGGAERLPGLRHPMTRIDRRRSPMGSRIDGSAIDKVLEEAVGTGAVPHVAAIAADRDGVLYEGGAGVRIMGESDDPVTTATQFRIMSMTKMVCAAAALQQVERGELDLDAPVDTCVPAFADLQVLDGFDDDTPRLRPPASRATVRHLVTHTAGLAYWFWDADLMRYEQVTGCRTSCLARPRRSRRR